MHRFDSLRKALSSHLSRRSAVQGVASGIAEDGNGACTRIIGDSMGCTGNT